MSAVIDILSWVFLVTGALFCVIGGVGLLRMPDLYTRTHAATITDTLGAGLVLVGLMFQGGLTLITVKLVFVLVLLYLTSPTSAHALVKAAAAEGVRSKDPMRPPPASPPARPTEGSSTDAD